MSELPPLPIDAELLALFVAEALDHLGTIESSVLALEASPDDPETINTLFRPFHTIKGNAAALGIHDVEELAHAVEDLLDRVRQGERRVGPSEAELILAAVDLLSAMIRDIDELAIVQSMIHQDPHLTRADERLNRNLAQLHRITAELQRGAIGMRLVPIKQTFQRMRRVVRDLSRKAHKPVELLISGEETELG